MLGIDTDVLQFISCACQIDIFASFGFGILGNHTFFVLIDRLFCFQCQVLYSFQSVSRQSHIACSPYIGILRRNRLSYGDVGGSIDASGCSALDIAGEVQCAIHGNAYVLQCAIGIYRANSQIETACFSCRSCGLAICTGDAGDVDVIFRTKGYVGLVFAARVQDANALIGFAVLVIRCISFGFADTAAAGFEGDRTVVFRTDIVHSVCAIDFAHENRLVRT